MYLKNLLLYNVILLYINLEWDYFIELINLNSYSLFKIDFYGVRRVLYIVNKESIGLIGVVIIS